MIPTGQEVTVAATLLHVFRPQQEELLVTVVPHTFIPLTASEVRSVNLALLEMLHIFAHVDSKSHPIHSPVLVSIMKPIKVERFPQK